MYKGLQSSIWENRSKTIVLLFLFPALLYGLLYIIVGLIAAEGSPEEAAIPTSNIIFIGGPIIIIWGIISFMFHRQIIFKFAGARPITRKENPEIYNIVENLCISKGLQTPNIGIIDDDSYNAFATGWNEKNAWIVFSKGIIEKLDKREIEAVAAHELTHIINKDSLIMIITVVFIGIIATIGEIMFRVAINSGRGGGKKDGRITLIFILIGITFLLLGYIFYPLIRLAISRKREYLADAGAVELTKDNQAMISALQKISSDPVIEVIKKQTVAAMCIASPFEKASKFFSKVLSTHPPIEDRIKALQSY